MLWIDSTPLESGNVSDPLQLAGVAEESAVEVLAASARYALPCVTEGITGAGALSAINPETTLEFQDTVIVPVPVVLTLARTAVLPEELVRHCPSALAVELNDPVVGPTQLIDAQVVPPLSDASKVRVAPDAVNPVNTKDVVPLLFTGTVIAAFAVAELRDNPVADLSGVSTLVEPSAVGDWTHTIIAR